MTTWHSVVKCDISQEWGGKSAYAHSWCLWNICTLLLEVHRRTYTIEGNREVDGGRDAGMWGRHVRRTIENHAVDSVEAEWTLFSLSVSVSFSTRGLLHTYLFKILHHVLLWHSSFIYLQHAFYPSVVGNISLPLAIEVWQSLLNKDRLQRQSFELIASVLAW